MILDKRILKGKTYLDCFDTEEAKQFIGKKCYFTRDLSRFENLDGPGVYKVTLTDISDHYEVCYGSDELGIQQWDYARFIIPCEWVKGAIEEKYRPFSIEDWKLKHSIGETILYRFKGTYCGDHREAEVMYLGYVKPLDRVTDEAGKGYLVLGNDCHDLQNLFDNYEIWIDGGWRPFGIEE